MNKEEKAEKILEDGEAYFGDDKEEIARCSECFSYDTLNTVLGKEEAIGTIFIKFDVSSCSECRRSYRLIGIRHCRLREEGSTKCKNMELVKGLNNLCGG